MDFKSLFRQFLKIAFVGGILAIFHTQALAQKMDYQLAGNLTGVKELSLKEVKDIFKGRRTFWANGEEMLIGLPSSKAPHAELVASSIFGTTVNGMQKYWLSLVFQGRGKSPQFFSSPEEMMQWIQNNPGAIGIFPLGYPIPNANLIRIKP